jgi:hypothetical protein
MPSLIKSTVVEHFARLEMEFMVKPDHLISDGARIAHRRQRFVINICRLMLLISVLSSPFSILPAFSRFELSTSVTAVSTVLAIGLYSLSWWLAGHTARISAAAWLLIVTLNLVIAVNFLLAFPSLVVLIVFTVCALVGLIVAGPVAAYLSIILGSVLGFGMALSEKLVANVSISPNSQVVLKSGGIETVAVFSGTAFVMVYLAAHLYKNLAQANQTMQEQASQLAEALANSEQKRAVGEEVSRQVISLTSQLKATSSQQAQGSRQQAGGVVELTNSMVELSETALQIAAKAKAVTGAAHNSLAIGQLVQQQSGEATTTIERGQTEVKAAIERAEQARQRIEVLAQRLLKLTERSKEAGSILNLINEIADETHLLALNAAIENAGSGESGRRFDVVASEVKSLADRSLEATQEVQRVIAEMQGAVAASVLAAEEARKEMLRVVERSYLAGAVVEELGQVVEQANRGSSQIGRRWKR